MVSIGPYNIELVPGTSFGKSLSQLAGRNPSFRTKWVNIRNRELSRAGNKCELCGIGQRLECNERWSYDDGAFVQKLAGYEIVCHDCHSILHIGRTFAIGQLDKATAHFTHVTGLKDEDLMKATAAAYAQWHERSKHNWRVDISSEPLAAGYSEALNGL